MYRICNTINNPGIEKEKRVDLFVHVSAGDSCLLNALNTVLFLFLYNSYSKGPPCFGEQLSGMVAETEANSSCGSSGRTF